MRLIDADALKKNWGMANECEDCQRDARDCRYGMVLTRMDVCEMLDEAPTVGGWISVKERMPERGNTCLVWLRGGGMTFMVFDGSRFVGGSAYSDDRITHWMLLPGAPEEVSGDA